MGLDMYLTKKTYIGFGAKVKSIEFISETEGQPITTNVKPERVQYIIEEIGYWRKVNAIHKWFVDNVQHGEDDCKEYYVSKDQIMELLSTCKKIKESPTPEICEELLPTQEGFFFGDTSYGDGYMRDIDETIEILEMAAKEEEGYLYYRASW